VKARAMHCLQGLRLRGSTRAPMMKILKLNSYKSHACH